MKRFPVITLCGSTKFKKEFIQVGKILSDMGYIVLTIHEFSHSENTTLTEEKIKELTEMHFQRIRMSDSIFVINLNGYIGNGTKKEIEYAKQLKKIILFYDKDEYIPCEEMIRKIERNDLINQ